VAGQLAILMEIAEAAEIGSGLEVVDV